MQIKSRTELGHLFESVRNTGFGVEIGVERGWNAINILQHYQGVLICVDIWEDSEIEAEFDENIKEYKDRIIKMKMSSVDAHEIFGYDVFDFIHIDGSHDYNSIEVDYLIWSWKVREGGIVSFHDYGVNEFDVKKYVDSLTETIYITTDDYWEGKEYQTAYYYK